MHFQTFRLGILITLLTLLPAFNFKFSAPLTAAQVLAQTPDSRKAEADRLFQQGLEQYQTSQFEAALQSWQQALTIYRQIKDRQREGWVLGGLGLAYNSLGDYAQAIDYQKQWLAIAREIHDRQYEGKALGNLGLAYIDLGNYTQAIDYSKQFLAIAREIHDRQSEGAALGNLGVAYYSLGDYAQAIDYQKQWMAIAREIHERQSEAAALGNLGNAYYSLRDYAQAIDYSKQFLAIAREIHDRQGEGKALGNLGNAYYSLGDYAQAIDYQKQWLAIAREIHDRQSEGTALNNLGYALHKSGNLTEAEKTLIEGINVWESLRAGLGSNDANKVSIFEGQARTYRSLQQVLMAQNKTDAALEITERGRARAFVELLARQLSTNPTQATPIAPPTIEQIKQIAKAQNATLVQYSIIYDNFKVQSKQESHESELYIWVIKPTGEVTFRSSDLKPLWQQQNTTLSNLVTTSRESIGVRGRGGLGAVANVDGASLAKQLQQLHQLLIQPIADLLPTNDRDRVIFIPQSSLFLVPFGALQDKDGKYLIEKHTILTAPSIQVLDLTHKQRENLPTLTKGGQGGVALVVGNPTMPFVPPAPGEKPQQLPSLPGAETEAKAIAGVLNTKVIIGSYATKSAIVQLMPKARIIHLATHGLLDDERGIGSAIALAPDSSYKEEIGKVNGLLTAAEILDMKLNAELVILSACDTGRGKITGDGVIGLSRSLISAGVPSVIVSLWSVPDAPTASLMTEFYQNLQKNPDKAQALRQAILTTLKQRTNPKNWAAFTLIGESN